MAPRTKVEKRMDEEGVKYTKDEFIEFYGQKKGAKKWDAAGEAPASKSTKACSVCGNANHAKADCKFKDKECTNCGKVGHLKKVCRAAGGDGGADDKKSGAKADGKACSVCGKTNHLKADCKFKDKECSTCGKTGHLAAVCRSSGAKDGAKPKAKAKAKAKSDKKVETAKGSFKVCVVGGAGGIGQPLCLLMAKDPNVAELNVYDLTISMVPAAGVAADLSHINTRCKVNSFSFDKDAKAVDVAEECLTGCDLVLVPAGVPRKPGQDRKDLLNINCGIAKNIVEACAKFCPKAVIGLIVNPVNSVVPAMTELWKKKGLDPRKIAGVTTLDVVRAGKFVHNITGAPINRINIPVVGGHAGVTILPLFSQDKSSAKIDAEKIPELDKSVQDAGTVVVAAKAGKGSATLSMAFAGARFGSSVLRGLTGKRTVECAYVESSVQEGLTYFTSKVALGKEGVEKVLALGELNEYEKGRLAELTPTLLEEIQCGLDYAKENEFA